jgi:Cof subfamily protein (haloacid dehalogenase superfamily)
VLERPISFPYRLIATDLDGTLLRSDDTLSRRTRQAFRAVTAAGAVHVAVTGRAVRRTRGILRILGYRGLAVCGQGAQVYDAAGDRLLTSMILDRNLAETAIGRIQEKTGRLALAVSQDGLDGEMIYGPGYVQVEGPPATAWADRPGELWSAPVNKVYIQHPELSDDALTRAAQAAVGGLVTVVLAGAGVVEILPLGLSKATGLDLVARRIAVDASESIAFGDMPNDIPMLNWAGHGVAMANAHEELKAVADEITASNNDDGVATVLERLLQADTLQG